MHAVYESSANIATGKLGEQIKQGVLDEVRLVLGDHIRADGGKPFVPNPETSADGSTAESQGHSQGVRAEE